MLNQTESASTPEDTRRALEEAGLIPVVGLLRRPKQPKPQN